MRWLKRSAIILFVLLVLYSVGPNPATPIYSTELPSVPSIDLLENYISSIESAHHLRPNNEARVVWANDSVKQKTDYAIVYLHGFSASQEEGNPVHRNIAKQFGCNLYNRAISKSYTRELLEICAAGFSNRKTIRQ